MKILYTLLLVLSFNCLSQYWTDDPSTVLHIDFETNVSDSKGHAFVNDVSVIEIQSGARPGTGAGYFEGATPDYIQIAAPGSDDLSIAHDSTIGFTIQMVFKSDRPADITTFDYIFWKRSGLAGYSFSIDATNDRLLFFLSDGTNHLNAYYNNNQFNYIDGGIWYMITVVFDNPNNQTIMYLNGAQLGNAIAYPAYSAPTDPSVYLRVGRTSATNYFKGWFDEIIMYNATKTSSEILAYYNQYITYPRSGATEVVRGGNNKNNANLKPLGF